MGGTFLGDTLPKCSISQTKIFCECFYYYQQKNVYIHYGNEEVD